eukprot:517166_1
MNDLCASQNVNKSFKKNDIVFIRDLKTAKHLNNRIGIVQHVVKKTATMRYKTIVTSLKKAVSIKPENIVYATNINEIEAILRHLGKDEKCAMVSQCVGNQLPSPIQSINAQQYYKFKKCGEPAGCKAVYFALKYLILASSTAESVRNFEMKYDDYDGKQKVLHKLRSFAEDAIEVNTVSVCLLELTFVGFEQPFPTNFHMMGIIKCNNKFRIVQSFEKNFSLNQELDARDWMDVDEMKRLIQCIIDVIFCNNSQKAMIGFQTLYRYPLKTDKKKFKNRKCGCFGIYVSDNIDAKQFIHLGNTLVSNMLKQMKLYNSEFLDLD